MKDCPLVEFKRMSKASSPGGKSEKVEIKKVGGKRAVKIEEAVPRRKRAAVKEETISNENIKVEIKTEVKQEDLLIKSEDE